ncbi:MAG: hypothetical protein IPJ88_02135 [Myxococcales bacterium]|nr:MAG: hypothetical protein IPJ88_02135 [Myxococcales bacterium]
MSKPTDAKNATCKDYTTNGTDGQLIYGWSSKRDQEFAQAFQTTGLCSATYHFYCFEQFD